MTATSSGSSWRLVQDGADDRASDLYRFDVEQKRRLRLGWLSRLPKGRTDVGEGPHACFGMGEQQCAEPETSVSGFCL